MKVVCELVHLNMVSKLRNVHMTLFIVCEQNLERKSREAIEH